MGSAIVWLAGVTEKLEMTGEAAIGVGFVGGVFGCAAAPAGGLRR